jgi:hypothetical protein
MSPDRTSGQASLSELLGSYLVELKGWVARIKTGYALAATMLLAGALSIAIALGVGIAALFHWLAGLYGPYVGYGMLGGLFLLVGLVCIVVGLQRFKRPMPAIPLPRRQAQALKRAVAAPAVARLVTNAAGGSRPDKVTQALAGAAAVALLGWIATSYVRRSSLVDRWPK